MTTESTGRVLRLVRIIPVSFWHHADEFTEDCGKVGWIHKSDRKIYFQNGFFCPSATALPAHALLHDILMLREPLGERQLRTEMRASW